MNLSDPRLIDQTIHVLPLNDLKSHSETGTRCACQPRIENGERGNVIVVHNAYDGREFYEHNEAGAGD